MLVAAAVAAVLLAGGGATYALVDRGGSATDEDVAGGSPGNPDKGADGRVLDPGAVTPEDKSPSAKPKEQGDKKSKPPKGDATSPAPGGGPGGSDAGGKGNGGSDGGSSGSGDGGTGGNGGGGGSNGGGGGGTDPAPAPVCHPIGGGKYNCQVWRQANSYTADGTQVGVLNAGTNYFYCQQNLGRRETSGRWTNVWWAKTDDDKGNTNVFVSDVYISGGDNDQPLPGLPVC
ncbi:hypothetical protein ACFUN8_11245 [Streptomyces sp. NPDC057307]|uniref:hypothetical protein n=1 Tax=Streptomyces sp. NPDC057307 TaxID=3346096 RepID=UPI00362C8160